jgi:hypothetical protein
MHQRLATYPLTRRVRGLEGKGYWLKTKLEANSKSLKRIAFDEEGAKANGSPEEAKVEEKRRNYQYTVGVEGRLTPF